MNYKIRDAQEKQVPYMLVIGDKEMESGKVNVRYRRSEKTVEMTTEEFISKMQEEISTRSLESFIG